MHLGGLFSGNWHLCCRSRRVKDNRDLEEASSNSRSDDHHGSGKAGSGGNTNPRNVDGERRNIGLCNPVVQVQREQLLEPDNGKRDGLQRCERDGLKLHSAEHGY